MQSLYNYELAKNLTSNRLHKAKNCIEETTISLLMQIVKRYQGIHNPKKTKLLERKKWESPMFFRMIKSRNSWYSSKTNVLR